MPVTQGPGWIDGFHDNGAPHNSPASDFREVASHAREEDWKRDQFAGFGGGWPGHEPCWHGHGWGGRHNGVSGLVGAAFGLLETGIDALSHNGPAYGAPPYTPQPQGQDAEQARRHQLDVDILRSGKTTPEQRAEAYNDLFGQPPTAPSAPTPSTPAPAADGTSTPAPAADGGAHHRTAHHGTLLHDCSPQDVKLMGAMLVQLGDKRGIAAIQSGNYSDISDAITDFQKHHKPPLKVDGIVGEETSPALIRAYQESAGLTADGVIGRETKARLQVQVHMMGGDATTTPHHDQAPPVPAPSPKAAQKPSGIELL